METTGTCFYLRVPVLVLCPNMNLNISLFWSKRKKNSETKALVVWAQSILIGPNLVSFISHIMVWKGSWCRENDITLAEKVHEYRPRGLDREYPLISFLPISSCSCAIWAEISCRIMRGGGGFFPSAAWSNTCPTHPWNVNLKWVKSDCFRTVKNNLPPPFMWIQSALGICEWI